MTDAFETEKREKEKLQKTVDELIDLNKQMKQNHKKDFDREKAKVDAKDHEELEIMKEFLEILEEYKAELATGKHSYDLLTKAHKETTEENRQLKLENWSFKQKQSNSMLKYTVVSLGCIGVVIVIGWWSRGRNTNSTLPVRIDYGKNTGNPAIPLLQIVQSQSDIQYQSSGITYVTNTYGTFYSGAFSDHNGATYGT